MQGWSGAGRLLPRWLIHMPGKLVLVEFRRPQSIELLECPHNVTASLPRMILQETNRSHNFLYNLTSLLLTTVSTMS
jgi:hypothetical protein